MRYFILSIMLVVLLCSVGHSQNFSAVSKVGIGWLMPDGQKSKFAYVIGFSTPVVQKESAGYRLLLEPTTVYSNFDTTDVNILRVFSVNEKDLYTKKRPIYSAEKADSVVGYETSTRLWFGLGGGLYKYVNNGPDSEVGAITLRLGAMWKGVTLEPIFDVTFDTGKRTLAPYIVTSISF